MDMKGMTPERGTGGRETEALRAGLSGELLRPADGGYEEARTLWNAMIDRYPALIARCADAADVITCVNFARDHGMELAVRGGGHNVAGLAVCDGGLAIDLSPMKGVEVDAGERTVRAGAGLTLGELDRETQKFGLAAPLGLVSETGIAGLTLGGGMGWLRRRHGLSCDNLLSVEVVTADGRFLRASESEHTDIFWGIRGGGGNFGVVTSFEYRLHPVGPRVFFCFVLYPGERAEEVLGFCGEYLRTAPDDVSPLGVLGRVPAAEPFPAEWHGEPFVALLALHPDSGEGERILAPLRGLGDPIADLSGPMLYTEAQKFLDEDYPDGWRYYWKSQNIGGLNREVIGVLTSHANAAPSDHSTVDVWYQGGAMGRIGTSETAFGDRSAPMLIGVEANWEGSGHDAANIGWARGCVGDLRRFSDGGGYLNFPGFLEEGERQLRESFGGNYGRLVELKNRYDPENLFHLNHNIKPLNTTA